MGKLASVRVRVGEREQYLVNASYTRPYRAHNIRRARHDHCFALGSDEPPAALAALRHMAVQHIGPVTSVVELFAGRGFQSGIIQDACHPTKHVAYTNRTSLPSIKRSFPNIVRAKKGDDIYRIAYRFGARDFDWVHADFNHYTFMNEQKSKRSRYRLALEGMFRTSSRFVSITDATAYGIARFGPPRRAYAKRYGMDPDNWEDYYRVTANYYKEQFDFGVVAVVSWFRVAAYVLLERAAPINYKHIEITEKIPIKILGEVQ